MIPFGPADDAIQIMRWTAATMLILGALTWAWFYTDKENG